jgi:hypothetical protein
VTKSNTTKNSLQVTERYRYLTHGSVKFTVDEIKCEKAVDASLGRQNGVIM